MNTQHLETSKKKVQGWTRPPPSQIVVIFIALQRLSLSNGCRILLQSSSPPFQSSLLHVQLQASLSTAEKRSHTQRLWEVGTIFFTGNRNSGLNNYIHDAPLNSLSLREPPSFTHNKYLSHTHVTLSKVLRLLQGNGCGFRELISSIGASTGEIIVDVKGHHDSTGCCAHELPRKNQSSPGNAPLKK